MNGWMTRLAQRNKIALIMCATFTQRYLMMYFLGLHKHTALITNLTERMLWHILVTDSFPRPSISLLCSRCSLVLFISAVHLFGMFLTIPSIRKVRTTGETAWSLWSSRHSLHLDSLHRKSPTGISSHRARLSYTFDNIILTHIPVPCWDTVCQPLFFLRNYEIL